jgi:hypothetical protein
VGTENSFGRKTIIARLLCPCTDVRTRPYIRTLIVNRTVGLAVVCYFHSGLYRYYRVRGTRVTIMVFMWIVSVTFGFFIFLFLVRPRHLNFVTSNRKITFLRTKFMFFAFCTRSNLYARSRRLYSHYNL